MSLVHALAHFGLSISLKLPNIHRRRCCCHHQEDSFGKFSVRLKSYCKYKPNPNENTTCTSVCIIQKHRFK